MTRDEILNMPAGREMDALVAEALGFSVNDSSDNPWAGPKPFSTDIAAAWEVVDAGCIHAIRRVVNDEPDSPELWQALIYADLHKAGIADTAPLAICRAALLAAMT